uniref:Uncharacterized protein n=1 Tax=Escherichia coli TaxID=562 RepID=A0A7G9AA00_ECOLX|nr:hypothetical protein [Escherichia coli]
MIRNVLTLGIDTTYCSMGKSCLAISRLCIINQKFRLNSRHRYMNKLRLMLSVITLNQSRSLRFVRLMRITENVRTLLF